MNQQMIKNDLESLKCLKISYRNMTSNFLKKINNCDFNMQLNQEDNLMHKVMEIFGQYLLTPNAIQALDLQKGFDNLHDRHDTVSEVGRAFGNYHTIYWWISKQICITVVNFLIAFS
jgi:hypothetical protein